MGSENNMVAVPDLAACPFCGYLGQWEGKGIWRVACTNVTCGAKGPWAAHQAPALVGWETRIPVRLAQPDAQQGDVCVNDDLAARLSPVEGIEPVGAPKVLRRRLAQQGASSPASGEGVEPDVFGNEGVRSECMTCAGAGVDYGETCVSCGGLGWVREPAPLAAATQPAVPQEGEVTLREAARDLLEARKRLGYAVHDRIDLWSCLAAIVEDAA